MSIRRYGKKLLTTGMPDFISGCAEACLNTSRLSSSAGSAATRPSAQ